MKGGVINILKARFLVNEDATKTWRFLLFLVALAIIMIANSHQYDQKIFKIADLTNEVKESTVSEKMKERGVFSSQVPPQKIKVKKTEEKSFFKKLWQ